MCSGILIALRITETCGMARSQITERVEDFQIWWVAANILNKQLQTSDRKRSSCFGVRGDADNSSEQIRHVIWDNLSSGKCT
jgi:hypothetical protein